jgi:hypothetical protein
MIVGYCQACQCSYVELSGFLEHEPHTLTMCERCSTVEAVYLVLQSVVRYNGSETVEPVYVCEGCK